MKKRVLLLVVSLCFLMLAGGCSNKKEADKNVKDNTTENTKDDATQEETEGTDTTDGATTEPEIVVPEKEAYVVGDYITLGQYKGIEVKVDKLEVTEEDINKAIDQELTANTATEEITDRTDVQNGDIANIDYEGLKDGVAFEGGTAKDFDLTIGSGQFIPGFEEQLVGKKVGEKAELKLSFPEEYPNSPDLAGQEVVFKVTVNAIKKEVVPVLNEEFVKANTEYDTVDAYKESIRKNLEAQNQETMKNQKIDSVLTVILDNAKVSSYPQNLIDYYAAVWKKNNLSIASYYYQMDYETFLSSNGMTEEDFNNTAKTSAESMAKQEMIIKAIIEAEKLELSEEEYKEGVTKLAGEYGFATDEEFLAVATEDEIRESLLWEKVVDFVVAEAVEL